MEELKNRELLIFSAELSALKSKPKFNKKRTEQLTAILDELQIEYIFARGCYNGFKEDAFIAFPKNKYEVDTVKNLVFINFKQESIVCQNMYGAAILEYANGKTEYIGTYTEITNTTGIESYTRTLDNTFIYS